MQTLIEYQLAEKDKAEQNTRRSYLTKIEYNWSNRHFMVEFTTLLKNGGIKKSRYPFLYKELIVLIRKNCYDQTSQEFNDWRIKRAFKRWQWEQLLTNLWFKAVYLSTWTNSGKLTNRLSEMKESKQYITECPTGILDFDNSKYSFEIPLILPTADYLHKRITDNPAELELFWEKVKNHYLQYLRDQFGPNVEIDYNFILNEELFSIDLIRIKNQEPTKPKSDLDKPEFVHPGN
jgi:hypothetical protein